MKRYLKIFLVGRTAWSAPDALVRLFGCATGSRQADQGVGRRPGGLPYKGLLLFALLSAASLSAQTSSGALVGVVRDESAALVQGVKVTLRNTATAYQRSTETGPEGGYQFGDVPPGDYSVTAEKQRFRPSETSRITIEVDRTSRIDFELKLGSEHETVTVSATSSPLQTEEASEGFALDSSTIANLPLDGRNITSLITLGPGAIPRQLSGYVHDIINDAQEARGAVAMNPPINGARTTMNTFLLDGAYNTDQNAYSIAVIPPYDSVQEFRTQSSLGSADFAQSGGGVVDVVTKPGSRAFHGGAFEFLRNEAIDARTYFADPTLPRARFRQNQYGASVGGPLPFHNTFFFVAYEGLRNQSAAATLHIVPDATLRTGDFSGRSAIFDPLNLDANGNRTPFPDNVIPSSHIDPIAQKYLSLYEPLPNQSRPGGNYLDDTPNRIAQDAVSGRIDRQMGPRDNLFVRYNLNNDNSTQAGNFPQLPNFEDLRAQQASIGYTHSSASWLNEARASFTRLRVFDIPESAFKNNVLGQLGITSTPVSPFAYGVPDFAVTDFELVVDGAFFPQTQRDNTWQLSDDFSIVRGRHTFKAGVQWIHFDLNYLQSDYVRGQYSFNGQFTSSNFADTGNTGDAFADFLLGDASSTRRDLGDAQAYLRRNTYGGFFQDEWRPTPRLTLTFGVRYEYMSPFSEANNRLLNLDYSTLPHDPLLKTVSTAGNPQVHDFAPRFGLAWRLPNFFGANHETVFRAGYGVYFSPEIAVEAYDLVRNNELNQVNESNPNTPTLTIANGFPTNSSTGFPTYYGLNPNSATPYVQQWSAGFQRDMGLGMLMEASYVGSKGTHLGRFDFGNTPFHTETGENLPPRPGDLQSLRTFPDLGPIYQIQHIANSSYNSLQLKAEKRFSGKLSFLASFVWSKSIDDADTIIPGLSDSAGAQDERNLRLERGLSSFNVGRRLSAGYVYNFGRSTFLRPVLSNWGLSGILTFQDGSPWNPFYFATDFANTGTPNRPNVVLGQDVNLPPSQRTAEHWFNTNAFSDPAPFTFGNAGRNILPSPGNAVVDMALHRRFAIRERASVDLRFEGFNILNHPNWGIPGQYPDFGPFFGRIFASGQPRRFQAGLHLDF